MDELLSGWMKMGERVYEEMQECWMDGRRVITQSLLDLEYVGAHRLDKTRVRKVLFILYSRPYHL